MNLGIILAILVIISLMGVVAYTVMKGKAKPEGEEKASDEKENEVDDAQVTIYRYEKRREVKRCVICDMENDINTRICTVCGQRADGIGGNNAL